MARRIIKRIEKNIGICGISSLTLRRIRGHSQGLLVQLESNSKLASNCVLESTAFSSPDLRWGY